MSAGGSPRAEDQASAARQQEPPRVPAFAGGAAAAGSKAALLRYRDECHIFKFDKQEQSQRQHLEHEEEHCWAATVVAEARGRFEVLAGVAAAVKVQLRDVERALQSSEAARANALSRAAQGDEALARLRGERARLCELLGVPEGDLVRAAEELRDEAAAARATAEAAREGERVAQGRCEKLEAEVSRLQQQLDDARREYNITYERQAAAIADERLAAASRRAVERAEARQRTEEAEAVARGAEDRCGCLQQQVLQLQRECAALEQRLSEREAAHGAVLGETEAELAQLQRQRDELETHQGDAVVRLQRERDDALGRAEASDQEHASAQRLVVRLQQELEGQHAELERVRTEGAAELERLRAEAAAAAEGAAAESAAELRRLSEEHTAERAERERLLAEREARLEEGRAEQQRTQERIAVLEQQLQEQGDAAARDLEAAEAEAQRKRAALAAAARRGEELEGQLHAARAHNVELDREVTSFKLLYCALMHRHRAHAMPDWFEATAKGAQLCAHDVLMLRRILSGTAYSRLAAELRPAYRAAPQAGPSDGATEAAPRGSPPGSPAPRPPAGDAMP